MKEHEKLNKVAQLTKIHLQAAQSEMRMILNREEGLRKNLDDLARGITQLNSSADQLETPARLARADIRWKTWVDQRRLSINSELAQVLAQKDVRRAKLKTAFGREEALKALILASDRSKAKIKRRKDDYAS